MSRRRASFERIPEPMIRNSRWNLGVVVKRHAEEAGTLDDFVRHIDISPPLFSLVCIRRLLALTDRELDKCAALSGAQTVPHSWGIRGEDLIARVDYIDGEPITHETVPQEIYDGVTDGLSRYNHWSSKLRRYHLYDMAPHQFMYGMNINDQGQEYPKVFLVDIEPVFRPKQYGGGY